MVADFRFEGGDLFNSQSVREPETCGCEATLAREHFVFSGIAYHLYEGNLLPD